MREELNRARAAAEKAAAASHKHQAAVAQLTGDNLVLVLRSKGAEDEAAALRKEREELRAAIDEQRGPWFDEALTSLPLLLHFITCVFHFFTAALHREQAARALGLARC